MLVLATQNENSNSQRLRKMSSVKPKRLLTKKENTLMVTINFTKGIYRVYNKSGILRLQRNFKHEIQDKLGVPVCVSSDGLIFGFLKDSQHGIQRKKLLSYNLN